MKKDIQDRKDISFLIDSFYQKVLADNLIKVFFTEIVKLSFEKHIPIMINFWSSVLLNEQSYNGNVMMKHLEINQIKSLEKKHLDRWLLLWNATIDDLFQGEIAELAKFRAHSIGQLMHHKLTAQGFI